MSDQEFVMSLWDGVPDEEITSAVKVFYDEKNDFLYLGDPELCNKPETLTYIGEYK